MIKGLSYSWKNKIRKNGFTRWKDFAFTNFLFEIFFVIFDRKSFQLFFRLFRTKLSFKTKSSLKFSKKLVEKNELNFRFFRPKIEGEFFRNFLEEKFYKIFEIFEAYCINSLGRWHSDSVHKYLLSVQSK